MQKTRWRGVPSAPRQSLPIFFAQSQLPLRDSSNSKGMSDGLVLVVVLLLPLPALPPLPLPSPPLLPLLLLLLPLPLVDCPLATSLSSAP